MNPIEVICDCGAPMENKGVRQIDYTQDVITPVSQLTGVKPSEIELPWAVALYKCPACSKRKTVKIHPIE